MAFLTDQLSATGVGLTDLIHIVVTGDTSQGNPAGSSYKATIAQVLNNVSLVSGYWTSGSTGTNSIKAINSTGLDSTGDRSVSWGNQTLASGNDSTAWGVQTSATTLGSTASGYQTLSVGLYSYSEGYQTTASGDTSHAEGIMSKAIGFASHAEGSGVSIGDQSHSEGKDTVATGNYSHAQNNNTESIGLYSHAGGNQSIASGQTSFVHSTSSLVTGNRSAILGGQNITGNTDDTVYVPDLVINKSAAVPTSSVDTVGEPGSITWDNTYFYWKTATGWLRVSGSTF